VYTRFAQTNGPNAAPSSHSNISINGQGPNGYSNTRQNGLSSIPQTGSNILPNGHSNIVYHGQQNTTPNRNGAIGSTRARNNSDSELPAGVFRTTWDWIADNFYGISETATPLGRGSYGKVFEVCPI